MLTVHGSELNLFMDQVIPPTLTIYAPDIAAVGIIFNVFSNDAVSARDSNLTPPRRRADALRVEPRSRIFILCLCNFGILQYLLMFHYLIF